MKLQLPSPAVRRYIYAVALAALGVLLTYHVVDASAVPEWANLLGVVLGISAPVVSIPAVNQKIAAVKLAKQ